MATGEEPSTSQFALLMDAIKSVEANVDAKLSTVKRQLSEERETADERLVKKLRLDNKPTFRRKGNEKQFYFNEQLRDKLVVSVNEALEQAPPAVEKAKTLLKEGEKLIDLRQKHIKIADRSEYGWATVAEYEEDELADNSEDEKRLSRAEGSAGRKQKRKNAVKETRKKGGAGQRRFASYSKPWVGTTTVGGDVPSPGAAALAGFFSQQLLQASRQPVASGSTNAIHGHLGPCFECGKVGHYKKTCPLLRAANPAMNSR